MEVLNLASILDVSNLPSYLEQVDELIEKVILNATPSLRQPLSRLTRSKSKRLRPSLVIAVAASQSKKVNAQVISAAAAIELVHIGSLIHDDIIDNASSRWSVPTINSQEGVNFAILAGDFLFSAACLEAAKVDQQVAKIIANSIVTICNGEAIELADLYNLNRSQASLDSAISNKTASLFASSCHLGGWCADLPTGIINDLKLYGHNFGMAFQYIDDILDFTSSNKKLGKPIGNDVVEGVYTYPILLALGGPSRQDVTRMLKSPEQSANSLSQLLISSGSIDQAVIQAKKYSQKARLALGRSPSKAMAKLLNFPDVYMEWALENLTKNPNS